MIDWGYFTVVFRGDVRNLDFNPMMAKTDFGEVVGVSIGDLISEREEIDDRTNLGTGQTVHNGPSSEGQGGMSVRVTITGILPDWWGADEAWEFGGERYLRELIWEDLGAFADDAVFSAEKLVDGTPDGTRTTVHSDENARNA